MDGRLPCGVNVSAKLQETETVLPGLGFPDEPSYLSPPNHPLFVYTVANPTVVALYIENAVHSRIPTLDK